VTEKIGKQDDQLRIASNARALPLMGRLSPGNMLENPDSKLPQHCGDVSEAVCADNECIHSVPMW
jgi:hypothetical protein